MGWVWQGDDDNDDRNYAGDVGEFGGSSETSGIGGHGVTRKVVRSQCRTEEVETGKFIRKCEKTEQVFRDCVGRPNEMVHSFKEFTEEDVTDQMAKGSFSFKPAENKSPFFPGLRSDFDAIERHLFSGVDSLFQAAEDMKREFFNSVWVPHMNDDEASSSFEKPNESFTKKKEIDLDDDLSRLAREI